MQTALQFGIAVTAGSRTDATKQALVTDLLEKKQILTNDSESKSDSVGEEGYSEGVCQLNQLLKQG